MKTTHSRPLEEQLDHSLVQRLRVVQIALSSLRVGKRVSSYYIFEIERAIEAGMLLAVFELSTTLLEVWVRDLLVIRKVMQKGVTSKKQLAMELANIDQELEGIERGPNFLTIVTELRKLDVLDDDEINWLRNDYQKTRNNIHHGLSGRLLSPNNENSKILAEILGSPILRGASNPTKRLREFEDFIDEQAILFLEELVNFLANHQIPKGGDTIL